MSRKTKVKKNNPTSKRDVRNIDSNTEKKIVSKSTPIQINTTQKNTDNLVAIDTKRDLIKAIAIVSAIFALEFAIFYATLK